MFATRTIVVSLLVGIGITLLAGLFPAIRATKVPPIAAVREGATLPKSRLAPFTPFIALALIALAVLLLGYPMFKDDLDTGTRLLSIAGGVLPLFVGVAMISSRLVRPLAARRRLPARIGGAAGPLARGNSSRNLGRTAATAAALMIGIALVTFVATLANGMKASNRGAIEEQVQGRLRRHVAGRLHAVRRRCRRRARARGRPRPRNVRAGGRQVAGAPAT